ncbi:hypothetical protein Tco_0797237, partial [Tanacetum coccineum]
NLVLKQQVEDFQLGIESYQTQLNLTKPRWEATGPEVMHDYKILDSPRAVLFRDKYGESSGTWKSLLVEEYAKETTDFYREPNDDIFSVASRTSCVTQAGSPPSMCQTISNIDAHVEGEQFHESKQSRMVRLGMSSHDPARAGGIYPGTIASVEVLRKCLKIGLEDSKPIKTPMSMETKLTRDEEGEFVDNTKYRGMIGTTHLGLWYPKGSGIETIVYADSDHAGDYVDRKSTSGVCTFMGCCLTSWFSKKQTALAISITKAEYVSTRKACQ